MMTTRERFTQDQVTKTVMLWICVKKVSYIQRVNRRCLGLDSEWASSPLVGLNE